MTIDSGHITAPQWAGKPILAGARFYKTAEMAEDVRPFAKGQVVSVRYTRTVFNQFHEQNEDLFHAWVGSGDKHPKELFARAFKNFVL